MLKKRLLQSLRLSQPLIYGMWSHLVYE